MGRITAAVENHFDPTNLPTSSRYPTIHFSLHCLARPNLMGSFSHQQSCYEANYSIQETAECCTRTCAQDCHSPQCATLKEPTECYRECNNNLDEEKPSSTAEPVASSASGARPKLSVLKRKAKALSSTCNLLHMDTDNESHIKFNRPPSDPHEVSVADVVNAFRFKYFPQSK